MGSKEIALFEDLVFQQRPAEMVEKIDEIQELIVIHCTEVYGMIPELYVMLQTLKVFFKEIDKIKRVKS